MLRLHRNPRDVPKLDRQIDSQHEPSSETPSRAQLFTWSVYMERFVAKHMAPVCSSSFMHFTPVAGSTFAHFRRGSRVEDTRIESIVRPATQKHFFTDAKVDPAVGLFGQCSLWLHQCHQTLLFVLFRHGCVLITLQMWCATRHCCKHHRVPNVQDLIIFIVSVYTNWSSSCCGRIAYSVAEIDVPLADQLTAARSNLNFKCRISRRRQGRRAD